MVNHNPAKALGVRFFKTFKIFISVLVFSVSVRKIQILFRKIQQVKVGWHIKAIDDEDVLSLPFFDVAKKLSEKLNLAQLSDASEFDELVHRVPQAATGS